MIKFFVNKPLFTVAIFIVILLLGLFSLINLPLEFLPNIEIPTLTIITPYPGASAEDIETTVSKVIEDAVATVPNIDKISSDSMENVSTVTLSFKWGTDLSGASADVRDKMDAIKSKLPDDVQPSTIFKFDTSQIPVLYLGISADQSYNNLYEIADKKISNSLKRITGVGTVSILGGLQRQINVEIDRHRLEAYHLSLNQVNGAIAASNMSMPAGSIKSSELEYGIRIPGEYSSVDQISKSIVGSFNNKNIYVSDVATVNDSFAEQSSMTKVDGRPGVLLMIQKQSGANSVNVVAACRKELERLKPELPQDIKIVVVMDTAESILRQIHELTGTLGWSFLFVVLTVLFFLRNIRGAVIVSLAIPFSLIAAFSYLYIAGGSINIISLASIIVAIGVVVDDAIVVMENVYRHKDKKKEGSKEAAIYGTGEVSGAVIASTTTNVVIFIPLLIVGGFVGIFFRQLSVITIVVISMSLVTAMSLTPMLCSKFLKVRSKGDFKNPFMEDLFNRSEAAFEYIENGYSRILAWALDRKKLVIISCTILFFVSMPMFTFVGTEFFPDQDNGTLSATIGMPSGTKLEETANALQQMQDKIKKAVPEMIYMTYSAGSSQIMSMGGSSGPNYGNIYMKLVPLSQRKRGLKELQRVVANIALSIPGIKNINYSAGGANALTGSDKPLTIEIYGSDFAKLDPLADELKSKIEKIPGVVDPFISREKANPEYQVNIDRNKASALGLTIADVSMAARGYLYGTTVSKYREGGDQYDIFTRLRQEDRRSLDNIKNTMITTRSGKNVTLSNIANIAEGAGPQIIQRKNQQRLVKVSADYYGRALGDIISDTQKVISKMSIPQEITIKMGGSAQSISEGFSGLFVALFLGLALLYLVMVAQFESFLEPFVVMFAIPFAIVGVVWALFFSGFPFGIMAFIGMIMVTGVAVKNSIVLIDYINILRSRGHEMNEAIKEAGKTRLRPILMTSSTAILGLMPIIFNNGEGSGFWKSMAIAVVGGLMVSATISLVFVPTLYSVFESRLKKRSEK